MHAFFCHFFNKSCKTMKEHDWKLQDVPPNTDGNRDRNPKNPKAKNFTKNKIDKKNQFSVSCRWLVRLPLSSFIGLSASRLSSMSSASLSVLVTFISVTQWILLFTNWTPSLSIHRQFLLSFSAATRFDPVSHEKWINNLGSLIGWGGLWKFRNSYKMGMRCEIFQQWLCMRSIPKLPKISETKIHCFWKFRACKINISLT